VVAFDLVASLWFYGLVLIWTACQFNWRGIDAWRLIGRVPDGYRWLPTVGLVALLILFSLGTFDLLYYPLSFVFPEYVESVLNEDYSSFHDLRVAFFAIVGAGVTEELLFRGIFLHRFTVKWGLMRALVVSSLLFGLGHFDILGGFAFAWVMTVLYLRTRTLLVPMACHALNNAIAVGWYVVESYFRGGKAEHYTLEAFRAQAWVSLIYLGLSTPLLALFIIRNWPRPDWAPPYFVPADGDEPAMDQPAEPSISSDDHVGTQVSHHGSCTTE
jgi:membrane protease YdiL (CAAX protease family)